MAAIQAKIAAKPHLFDKPPARLVPLDVAAAKQTMRDLAAAAKAKGLPRLAALLSARDVEAAFLSAVFDLSEFMRGCIRRRPEILDQLFETNVADRLGRDIGGCPPFAFRRRGK